MNPNAPTWGNQQGQNNQQQIYQQQQYNPYAQQQQQYNPYAQQYGQPQQYQRPPQPVQPQYNPYGQQQQFQQQQYYQQQQQQQQQQPQRQNMYAQQQQYNQQYNNYNNNQYQVNNQNNQYQAQQTYNNNQQNQYNAQQTQNQYNPQQPNRYKQPNQSNQQQQDNWDSPDEQTQPSYGNVQIQSKQNNQTNVNANDLDKSDEDITNQPQQQKKKKKRRGGRKKNKNKNNQQSTDNSNDNSNANTSNTSPNKDNTSNINNNDNVNDNVNDITESITKLNVEPAKQKEIEPKQEKVIKNEPKEDIKPKSEPKSTPKQSEKEKIDKPRPMKKSTSSESNDNKNGKKASKKGAKASNKEEKEEKKEEPKKKKKSKRVKWDAHDPREHLNLVLIGHVDAGKSTISGQILLATNQIDERTIMKYKKEAKEKNRESWWIAYIMDEDDEERNKGKTVECGRAHFDTDKKRYTILDAPGHKNYVPNMISGAQQADVAILVISARRGEFEAGFDRGGQTREHGLLALTLGITRVVIVVNKMDTMKWSQERYNDIKTRVTKFLCDDIGFKKKYIDILPISGQNAVNIKTPVTKDICPWYDGQTLLETLDKIKKVKRATGDHLRIPILDRYKGDKGLQAIGKVEAGIIKKGETVTIMPSEVTVEIIGLSIDDVPVDSVGAGENILITFEKGALTMDQIYGGCVICNESSPTKVVEEFLSEIYIHELPGGIMTIGYQAMFHCHNVSTMCEIVSIPHKLHKKTMKRSKMAPPFLRSHDRAIAKIKLDQKCALESFDDTAALGRFTLRDQGKTVVIGKIKQIFASKSRLKSRNKNNEQKSDKN